MTDNDPTEDKLKLRWSRFFRAFDAEQFSEDDFVPGTAEDIESLDPKADTIENSGDRGIYYYLDNDGRVLYVGSATVAFGTRFWEHYGKTRDRDRQDAWPRATRFQPMVLTAADDAKLRYAQAFESYLIATLKPPLNQKV